MKQRASLSILVLSLVVVILPLSIVRAASLADASLTTIEATLAAELARWKAPGLAAAIVSEGRLVWSHGVGLADVEQKVPTKAATVFRLASISKPITAVAVLQLAERGKLDLDAPIQRYCPTFPEKPWPVTSRQLLAHLGGIRGYKGEEFYNTRH